MKPGFLIFIISVALLGMSSAQAEYRTYKLGVRPKPDPKEKENVVYSTLDDQQYLTYFAISGQEYVRIIQHWMCYGRTDQFKKLCSQPPGKKDFPDPLLAATTNTEKNPTTPQNPDPKTPAPSMDQQPAQPLPATPAQNLGLR